MVKSFKQDCLQIILDTKYKLLHSFSSTATYTGFHVNRNGQGIAMRTQSTSMSHIDFTGELRFNNNWNNNANSAIGTEVMRIKNTGVINISNVPTSNTGLIAGDIWNDAGTLKIV